MHDADASAPTSRAGVAAVERHACRRADIRSASRTLRASCPAWSGHDAARRRSLAEIVRRAPHSEPAARSPSPPRNRARARDARPCRSPDGRGRAAGRRKARRLPAAHCASAPHSRSTASIRDGCGSISPVASSCQTRSGASVASSPDAASARSSASVSGATTKPNRAAKRATLSTRSGSSANAAETWRSMPAREVGRAAERIDQRAVLGARHRVDREVAPLEILLERHFRRGEELEAAIAAPMLALGARERVLLARLGMEKHREVAADRLVAGRDQHLGRRADDDPVAVAGGPAQELVAHRSADAIDLARAARREPCAPLRQRPPCAPIGVVAAMLARRARDTSGAMAASDAGIDAEQRRKRAVADAVLLHRREVVAAHRRARQELEQRACSRPRAGGSATIGRSCPVSLPTKRHELAQRVDVGPTQRISLPDRRIVAERVDEAMRDIAARIRAGTASARAAIAITGRWRIERREQIEKPVLAAEDHRGLEDRPLEPRARRSPPRLRPCCADIATGLPDRR